MGKRIVIAVIAIILVGVASMVVAQRRFIYLPTAHVADPPGNLGTEPIRIATSDGLMLDGTLVRTAGDALGTVIVFNGNAGNRGDRYPIAAEFNAAGFNTVLFDYRGYGGNPGRPSEAGLTTDALAVVAHVRSLPDIDPDRIVYFGESLGTGVAVAAAAVQPPASLILRSPYTSLPDAAAAAMHVAPIRPFVWDTFPTLETIPSMTVPVVVIAGSSDATIPLGQSIEVFGAVPGEKLLVVIEGAGHNDRAVAFDPIGRPDVQDFLRLSLARS